MEKITVLKNSKKIIQKEMKRVTNQISSNLSLGLNSLPIKISRENKIENTLNIKISKPKTPDFLRKNIEMLSGIIDQKIQENSNLMEELLYGKKIQMKDPENNQEKKEVAKPGVKSDVSLVNLSEKQHDKVNKKINIEAASEKKTGTKSHSNLVNINKWQHDKVNKKINVESASETIAGTKRNPNLVNLNDRLHDMVNKNINVETAFETITGTLLEVKEDYIIVGYTILIPLNQIIGVSEVVEEEI
ncbi:hypothetical protein M3589_09695 [Heyndrickxia oleronia]|uniref:hypothetical protein n=1 Tax=Heyndrickxia oleronia TaxID=38875 RepID=UPI00203A427E|nr:hypothetical protein [Heyndrickxia oleronia]MCM3238003.1 hypothetical protein [Heyndrickxia oleronia]